MRKNYLFAGLLTTTFITTQAVFAQLTQANEPSVGETQSMFLVDSFITNYSNVTGTGVTWDYSNMQVYFGETRSINVEDATATPAASSFAGAQKAVTIQGLVTTYYSSTASDRQSQGYIFTENTIGEVLVRWNNDTEQLATYPFAYGNSLVDVFSGQLEFSFSGFPQQAACAGNVTASIDGTGTLLFPSGVSVSNVTRYLMIDTAQANLPLVGDVQVVRHQYEYYDLANQSLPIFVHATLSAESVGGGGISQSNTLVLSKYTSPLYVGLESNEIASLTVYPNPSTGVFQVKGEFELADAKVFDMAGKRVANETVSNGGTLNLSNLNAGIYMLHLTSSNGTTVRKIEIK